MPHKGDASRFELLFTHLNASAQVADDLQLKSPTDRKGHTVATGRTTLELTQRMVEYRLACAEAMAEV